MRERAIATRADSRSLVTSVHAVAVARAVAIAIDALPPVGSLPVVARE
jgi:hypothetical protein